MISPRCFLVYAKQNRTCLHHNNFSVCVGARQNHYDVLEIAKDSSLEQVKNAFIKKSKLYHPDRHHGDTAMSDKFIKINQAYRVLSDPEQRALYNYELNKGGKPIHTVHRSRDYRNPYEKVKGFTTDWTDFYSTYGGGKAERDMKRDTNSQFWKDYMAYTKKFGGGEVQEGMSPAPKSTVGFEMIALSALLVVIYVFGFLHSSTNDKSMDHDRFDAEHMNWLIANRDKK